MNALKKIRLFETTVMSAGNDQQINDPQQLERQLSRAANIDILRMVYFDMFFLFLGIKTFSNQSQVEYLYLTKNMEIQKEFMIHNQTNYIDKVVNFDTKFLFTSGIDYQLDEQRTIVDEAQVIKIWDFQQLISGSDGYNAT